MSEDDNYFPEENEEYEGVEIQTKSPTTDSVPTKFDKIKFIDEIPTGVSLKFKVGERQTVDDIQKLKSYRELLAYRKELYNSVLHNFRKHKLGINELESNLFGIPGTDNRGEFGRFTSYISKPRLVHIQQEFKGTFDNLKILLDEYQDMMDSHEEQFRKVFTILEMFVKYSFEIRQKMGETMVDKVKVSETAKEIWEKKIQESSNMMLVMRYAQSEEEKDYYRKHKKFKDWQANTKKPKSKRDIHDETPEEAQYQESEEV